MTTERFRQLQDLFAQALERAPGERDAWCREATAHDDELQQELLRLLRNDARLRDVPVPSPIALGAQALEHRSDALRMPGRRIGRYELHEEIGRGGMGRVFRATRSEPGLTQEVAIKIVRRDVLSGPVVERFLVERRLLAGLNHPGIARLLDAGEAADGTPFVAMELVRGEALLEHCARRAADLDARLALFRQVLAAVSHAHRNLVVHRDIKPGNVLVDGDGQVKLLDFGIAKPLVAAGDDTATIERFATPAYAAPEQLTGAPASVAIDVYSLGALLFELLSGRAPFRFAGCSAAQVERLVAATPPPALEHAAGDDDDAARRLGVRDLRAWRRRLRGELDCIVQCAMRKEPGARYASVEQLDADIGRLLARRPVLAAGSQRGYRLRKFLARNRAVAAVVAIAATGLLLAFALTLRQAGIARQERDRAQAALAVLKESFKAADPMQASGGALDVRQVLDAAGRHVDQLATAQPRLHAELTAELGDVRLALGMARQGDPAMTQALHWAGTADGDAALARRLRLLDARWLVAAHRFRAADAALLQLERAAPDDAEVLAERAHYWLVRSQPSRAIPFAQRAVVGLAASADGREYANAAWQLAEAQRLAGQPASARATLDTLLALQQRTLAATHPRVLLTRLRRVDVLLAQGDNGFAVSEASALTAALSPLFGEQSSVLALTHATHATALSASERYADAGTAYEAASAAYAASLGGGHENAFRTRFNAAQMLAYVEAEPARVDRQFAGAIDGAVRARGNNDPLVTFFRSEYARVRTERGQLDAAREVLLPETHAPDLARMPHDNLEPLHAQLVELFGPATCPAARAPGAQSRAHALACAIQSRLRDTPIPADSPPAPDPTSTPQETRHS